MENSKLKNTKSYLITWNPKTWNWDNYDEEVKEVQKSDSVYLQWSCGNSKSIRPGDTIYLMRVGPNKPGIIGTGTALSSPFFGQHFSDEDREAKYIKLKLTTLLDVETDPILSLQTLKKKLPNQLWTPQASGISIKDDVIESLEKLWFQHIQNNTFSFSPLSEPSENSNINYEGRAYSVIQTKYERDQEARRQCLAKKGYKCFVCKLDFHKTYGEIGKGFIHVHHIIPVSRLEKPTRPDPENDLIPVCPNCHAMLHRKDPPLLPVELVELYKSNNHETP